MNKRTVTLQDSAMIPQPLKGEGDAFLHVVCTDSGFALKWVLLRYSPVYVNPRSGEKLRLTMSLTSKISNIPKHGKVVLTFEEILVSDDKKKILKDWNPSEWFEYEPETAT